ncbi:YpdA family putative bacillithiol disulfide reductase [Paenibacillus lutrae]|uniref:YpdA family putative bacillithiol disulfide reductase n=1 Tax=Paenibacillus lutrae TaxID=2078573 RepID=A0A7X3K0E8_9BACL|nr:YpdA family putative bacillithiol disulfide reductase [Paenibacillus lutrae]MVP01088.1 YpdA family putative bacillithiol disulfide reductase [Paenibacillus lutrae]
MEQVVIIGAGPCGISAAVEMKKAGIPAIVIEKNCLVHSIYQYPTHLQFFSTPDLLEIGDVPFTTPNDKPFRQEALHYYRNVARHYGLQIRSYEEVTSIRKEGDSFVVRSVDRAGKEIVTNASQVVISTGYFDTPNLLGIPGEDLPKVTHYYREAHPYTNMKVTIIGGNNSAVDAALDLMRVGADVTVVYRGDQMSASIKPWVRPIFESMVLKSRIRMLYSSRVVSIDDLTVTIDENGSEKIIDNDFVLALTGFRPDRSLLTRSGVELQGEYFQPVYNPDTMETTTPGLYVAGVIASGHNANEIFIESGRKHGKAIADHLLTLRENR